MNEPIENIKWVHWRKLAPNDWNPNFVMAPELTLLEHSILAIGWIQPILVSPEMEIIDGFHRWLISSKSQAFLERWGGKVPVVIVDVPRWKALCMTVRINRAKGSHGAREMSDIVRELVDEHSVDRSTLTREMGMTNEEIDLLYSEGVFKARKVKAHKYSKAWVPIEDDPRRRKGIKAR